MLALLSNDMEAIILLKYNKLYSNSKSTKFSYWLETSSKNTTKAILYELLSNIESSNYNKKNNISDSKTSQDKKEEKLVLLLNLAIWKNILLAYIRKFILVTNTKK